MNKLNREIEREEDLLFDMDDRLKNLPATLRSYEKREEYLEMIEEIKDKINDLKRKAKDVREKLQQDEREMNSFLRGPRKKPADTATPETKTETVASTPAETETVAETPVVETVVAESTVEPIHEIKPEPASEQDTNDLPAEA
jgi:chromosome segregation ATPase